MPQLTNKQIEQKQKEITSLKNSKKKEDIAEFIMLNLTLAEHFFEQSNFSKAISHRKDIIIPYDEIVSTYNNNSNVYQQAANLHGISHAYRNLEKWDEALTYANKGIECQSRLIDKKNDDHEMEATLLNDIGLSYYGKKDYKTALEKFEAAVTLLKTLPHDHDLIFRNQARFSDNISRCYFAQGDYQNEKKWILQAIGCITKIKTPTVTDQEALKIYQKKTWPIFQHETTQSEKPNNNNTGLCQII